MTSRNCSQRHVLIRLATIAALLLLLIAGGFWAYRTNQPTPPPAQQRQGPLANLSQWIEPPQRKVYPNDLLVRIDYLVTLQLERLDVITFVQTEPQQSIVQKPAGADDFVEPLNMNKAANPPAVDDGAPKNETK